MKKLMLLFLLLLMIGMVLASSTTTKSRPVITFSYEEQVRIDTANLTDDSDNNYALIITPSSGMNRIYTFQPEDHLHNQEYTLAVKAADFVGNKVLTIYNFIVNAPYMWMIVTEPHMGISVFEVFNATIETENAAECSYGFTEAGLKPLEFDETGSFQQKLYNVNNATSPIHLTAGSERKLFLECIDTTGRVHLGSVVLGYDPSAPSIIVVAVPNPVIDIETHNTTLKVESNDKVVCTYKNEGVIRDFPGNKPNNASTYDYKHKVVLDYLGLIGEPPENVVYEIRCTNLAGLERGKNYTVRVEFTEQIGITMRSPGSYTKANPVIFQIETSVKATGGCQFTNDSNRAVWYDFESFSPNQRIFSQDMGNLPEEEYKYWVKCVSAYGPTEKPFKFQVDRTKPGKPSIDTEDPSCSLSRLVATFDADDNDGGSGIGFYNYTVMQGSDNVIGWRTTTSGGATVNTNLEENETYSWKVYAVDNAGNKGDVETKNTRVRNPDNFAGCDTEPPLLELILRTTNDSVLINVTCADDNSGCTNSYKYDLEESFDDCDPTTSKNYGTTLEVTQTAYFCYIGFDNAGNNASGLRHIILGGSCNNGIEDGNETDIDCGGVCEGCGENEYCDSNSDCESGACVSGECTTPVSLCSNGVKDGDETDIDCGGSCTACGINKSCEYDPDCITGYCHNGTICKEATCDDGVKNGGESDIDCGGPCPVCPNGKGCKYNTDCSSGFCDTDKICKNATDQPPPPGDGEGFNLPFWLLIIGLILFGGGLGYMIYSRYFKEESYTPQQRQQGMGPRTPGARIQRYSKPQNTVAMPRALSPQEQKEHADRLKLAREVARERAAKKKQRRTELMKAFDSGEKKNQSQTPATKPAPKETPTQAKKQLSKSAGKKTEENGGYINLDDLHKGATKKKERDLKKGDMEDDVFQRLKAISGKDSEGKKKSVSSTKKQLKEQGAPAQKTPKATGLKAPSKPTEPSTSTKGSATKPLDMPDQDIFKKLAAMSGESHDNVKKAVQKDKIKKDDMMSIFANVTEKKQLDMDVFKAILSTLVNQGKIEKKEVSDILLEFYDKKLLTEKELYSTMKELKLI
ncbi:MAG: hypothetical protein ABIE94_04960 [archaeon]